MIGLGSIGKRHIENLVKVLKESSITYHIDALRSNHTELDNVCAKHIMHQYYDINEIPNDYDVIFITNPTSLHYETIKNVLEKTKHIFIEKPVFDKVGYNISSLHWKPGNIYYVACPLRHKRILKYVKEEIVNKENIISARIISTSYLPSWRRNVDYREVYSAKRSLGGGVSLDLIHEWDYAIDLFGIPDKVYHMSAHMSKLEIDSDDVSVYMAKYKNMFLEIHLDYIGHKTERQIQLFTDNKRIDADLIKNMIYEYEGNKLIGTYDFGRDDFYINEMEYFIDCINGKCININTVENAYKTLKIALTEE